MLRKTERSCGTVNRESITCPVGLEMSWAGTGMVEISSETCGRQNKEAISPGSMRHAATPPSRSGTSANSGRCPEPPSSPSLSSPPHPDPVPVLFPRTFPRTLSLPIPDVTKRTLPPMNPRTLHSPVPPRETRASLPHLPSTIPSSPRATNEGAPFLLAMQRRRRTTPDDLSPWGTWIHNRADSAVRWGEGSEGGFEAVREGRGWPIGLARSRAIGSVSRSDCHVIILVSTCSEFLHRQVLLQLACSEAQDESATACQRGPTIGQRELLAHHYPGWTSAFPSWLPRAACQIPPGQDGLENRPPDGEESARSIPETFPSRHL